MSRRGRDMIVARLVERISAMDEHQLQILYDTLETLEQYDDGDGECEDESDDGENEDPSAVAAPPLGWPGSIRFTPVRDPVHGGLSDPLESVAMKHAFGPQVFGSADPSIRIAYAAEYGRRKAFGDLLHRLNNLVPPYDRAQILDVVISLDDPPWRTMNQEAPPGSESIAVLAGQWLCPTCSYHNNDRRPSCRNCMRRQP